MNLQAIVLLVSVSLVAVAGIGGLGDGLEQSVRGRADARPLSTTASPTLPSVGHRLEAGATRAFTVAGRYAEKARKGLVRTVRRTRAGVDLEEAVRKPRAVPDLENVERDVAIIGNTIAVRRLDAPAPGLVAPSRDIAQMNFASLASLARKEVPNTSSLTAGEWVVFESLRKIREEIGDATFRELTELSFVGDEGREFVFRGITSPERNEKRLYGAWLLDSLYVTSYGDLFRRRFHANQFKYATESKELLDRLDRQNNLHYGQILTKEEYLATYPELAPFVRNAEAQHQLATAPAEVSWRDIGEGFARPENTHDHLWTEYRPILDAVRQGRDTPEVAALRRTTRLDADQRRVVFTSDLLHSLRNAVGEARFDRAARHFIDDTRQKRVIDPIVDETGRPVPLDSVPAFHDGQLVVQAIQSTQSLIAGGQGWSVYARLVDGAPELGLSQTRVQDVIDRIQLIPQLQGGEVPTAVRQRLFPEPTTSSPREIRMVEILSDPAVRSKTRAGSQP